MRRRINLETLSDTILLALHELLFDDAIIFASFEDIRTAIPGQPANVIRLQLAKLVSDHRIAQQSEEREYRGSLGMPLQKRETYFAKVNGYRLTQAGIEEVNDFPDDYYQKLLAELTVSKNAKALDLWEPITLEHSEEEHAIIESLEKTVQEASTNNGYTAQHPSEKNYVVDKLSALTKRLKEDSFISAIYINEFALKPLSLLISRFSKSAIGLLAQGAREALISWLRSKGVATLDDVFK